MFSKNELVLRSFFKLMGVQVLLFYHVFERKGVAINRIVRAGSLSSGFDDLFVSTNGQV